MSPYFFQYFHCFVVRKSAVTLTEGANSICYAKCMVPCEQSPSIFLENTDKIEGDAARRVNAWLVNRMTGKSNEVACNIVHIGKQKSKN